ncbi:DUF4124 domain-containing protein [uncultured Shewanella sp.]|uniref:DUF4124 domain-containing protein n=1 Tax=uncultured Shewanella sp. TaxID=173975 RepID=UPI00260A1228|nr:DUF4124 domain-containing protein [uncultured Shewanella sp.]
MRLALIFCLLLFTWVTQATVYKWVDKDGKVHYSDKPISNSEVVEFKSNTQNQIKVQLPKDLAPETKEEVTPATQYKMSILSPKEDETIRDNNGDITIMATITPDLKPKHLLVLLMDDKVIGPPQETPIFSLKNIDRGEHSFVIKAVAQNGKQLASTPPRKIFLHRAIVNKKPQATTLN